MLIVAIIGATVAAISVLALLFFAGASRVEGKLSPAARAKIEQSMRRRGMDPDVMINEEDHNGRR